MQDVLVPGLEHDATVGGRLDVHVDQIGYLVEVPRAQRAGAAQALRAIAAKKG